MTNALDDTMKAAKNAMDTARESAGQAAETVKGGAVHVAASTRSAALEGLRAVTGLLATLRSFDTDDALGWVGLARRRRPLHTLAAFGAGVAVGAGVGMLLAPMSGDKLRGILLARLRLAKDRTKDSIDDAATAAKEVEKDVEHKLHHAKEQTKESIDRAATTAKKVERDLEHKVMAGVDAAKDAVAKQVGAAAQGVKEAAQGVEQMADEARPGPRDAKAQSPNGTPRPPAPLPPPTHRPH